MTRRAESAGALRVELRDVEPADVAVFFEHQADPVATRMAAFPPRDRERFAAHWAKILADGSVIAKTVLVDGEVAGNVVCFGGAADREVGYWIGREHWGRGVATEALARLVALVPTRPLFAHVVEHNAASTRVLEKCGFVRSRHQPPPDARRDGANDVRYELTTPRT